MNLITSALIKLGILKDGLDYHLIRVSMVMIFLFSACQTCASYQAQALIPHIYSGALISWMCTIFGVRGACYFLGISEWLFGVLLLAGFSSKKLGILGAMSSASSLLASIAIVPFMGGGWAALTGGFPPVTSNVAFLMKDLVLLAVSIYLLRQDVMRVSIAAIASDQGLHWKNPGELVRLVCVLQLWAWTNQRTLTVLKDS